MLLGTDMSLTITEFTIISQIEELASLNMLKRIKWQETESFACHKAFVAKLYNSYVSASIQAMEDLGMNFRTYTQEIRSNSGHCNLMKQDDNSKYAWKY